MSVAEESTFLADIIKDAENPTTPTNRELSEIAVLAQEQVDLERSMAKLEEDLDEQKKKYTKLRTETLPQLMQSLNVSSFGLTDGSSVEIDKEYFASITDERRPKAHAWLRANGHEDLIKNLVIVSFSKGQDKTAVELAKKLQAEKYVVEQKESVHGSTLKAFVREQAEKATPVPKETFGVFVLDVAKIKMSKSKGKK